LIKINKIKSILKFRNKEYKFLSPHVFLKKNLFYLFFCNRGTDKNNFYGEINLAKSSDLKTWKRNFSFRLKPEFGFISYLSPYIVEKKDIYFMYVEAQKKNFSSSIIRYYSKDFKTWSYDYNFSKKSLIYNYKSPSFFLNDKNYIYCSKEKYNKKMIIKFNVANPKLERIAIKSNYKDEKYSIYSPTFIDYKNYHLFFYAAWPNSKSGNIRLCYSKDKKTWKKIQKPIITLDKETEIISEPYIHKINSFYYLFFEYKLKNNKWNLSSKKIGSDVIGKILR
jgi:hypothetical protein